MKIYITYDRYENDEWYNIYNVDTNRENAVKHCKEVDLPKFLSYGPDDCHSFQLQEVEMTESEYQDFMRMINEDQSLENYGNDSSDLFMKMVEIYDLPMGNRSPELIINTDGCSDIPEIIQYYAQQKGIEAEDFEDVEDDLQMELFGNDELLFKVIQEYVNDTY